MTDFERARQEFPAATDFTYVDVAARNPLSRRVRAAIEHFLDERERGLDNKGSWFEKVETVRYKAATLIGAEAQDIAFTKNTSHGITSVIAALPWRAGDNVVIAPDFEHPNNVYAWLRLRGLGVEVRTIPLEGAVVSAEQIEAMVNRGTRAVGIASVSFATGGRVELERISRFCQDRNIFLLVDGVQSLGVLAHDVRTVPLDAVAAATSKSLLGLYGLGILYCRHAAALHPLQLSRFGVDLGDEEEYVQGHFDYELAAGAKRFDMGNYNYLAIHALDAALDHILEIGVRRIEAHVLQMSKRLTDGLMSLGFQVKSPTSGRHQSHVVVFAPPGEASIPDVSRLLNRCGIRHTIRRFGLRVSFHLYNNMDDVDRILAVLTEAPGIST